jgi:hypothetical protein
MSSREEAQQQLVEALLERRDRWDAPYGVQSGLHKLMRGAVRTVTFGVSRYLDATAYIWSADKITVRGQGALAAQLDADYASVAALVARLDEVLPPR